MMVVKYYHDFSPSRDLSMFVMYAVEASRLIYKQNALLRRYAVRLRVESGVKLIFGFLEASIVKLIVGLQLYIGDEDSIICFMIRL